MNKKALLFLEKNLLRKDYLPQSLEDVRNYLEKHTGRNRLTVGEEEACEQFWHKYFEKKNRTKEIGKDEFDRPVHPGDTVEVIIKVYNIDETNYQLIKLIGKVELFTEHPRMHIPFDTPRWGIVEKDSKGEVIDFVALDFDDPLMKITIKQQYKRKEAKDGI